ncbi:uncharacterized protein [Argopecten irradians]|uniref:uncharacterized protein isoform X4 n=1 Tax=Argopecten irradians TaxID=31199 RepID=UPI0037232BB1
MDGCVWLLCFLSAVQVSYTSVNTSRMPTIKTTRQSSNHNGATSSVKAVDGCRNQKFAGGCCSHTLVRNHIKQAWWQIDLGGQVVIERIEIIYRDDGDGSQQKGRFGGFQVFVSNTSTRTSGDRCYEDPTSVQGSMDLTPTISSCTGSTQYLTIYVDRRTRTQAWYSTTAILELCEVEVYGCPLGMYGQGNCDSSCLNTCVNGYCDPTTGYCQYCAQGAYRFGSLCTPCPDNCSNRTCDVDSGGCQGCSPGYHGTYCNLSCPDNCMDAKCNQFSRTCEGCTPGYHGTYCDLPCPDDCMDSRCNQSTGVCEGCVTGYHGNMCNLTCPENCKDKKCSQTAGICEGCTPGNHGTYCDLPCPGNCMYSQCDQSTGVCEGCVSGYHGNMCNLTCPENCKDKKCSQTAGICEDCEDGFFGPFCMTCSVSCVNVCNTTSGNCSPCRNGFFGQQCNTTCPNNCVNNTCIQDNGECLDCNPGYYGLFCNQSCPASCTDSMCDQLTGNCEGNACKTGFHGDRCDRNCSSSCQDSVCNKTTGICTDCVAGLYTDACNESCPINCGSSVCDRYSRECSDGCNRGFYGRLCNQSCPSKCRDSQCYQDTGICEDGCNRGFYGRLCNQSCPSKCRDSQCYQDTGICEECSPGYYSSKCNDSCPDNCKDNRCYQDTGECLACKDGFHGLDCNNTCGNCRRSSCSMSNGTCECTDGWGGDTCLTRIAIQSSSDSQTGLYAGAAGGAVVGILLAVIVTIVIIKRRKAPPNKEKNNSPNDKMSSKFLDVTSSSTTSKQAIENDNQPKETNAVGDTEVSGQVYINMQDVKLTVDDDVTYTNSDSFGIPIIELQSLIDKKKTNKAAAFQEEFKNFPMGAVYPHEAGKQLSNKKRNRFKTTFPYDHSRVILEMIGNDVDTTYINANYIDGVDLNKVYIASQGPKDNTTDDFWRMVWQVSSGKIVMLTNLIEGGIRKCHQYWPDEGEPLSTSTFQLTLDSERTYAFYVIRDVTVLKKKTREERQIQQFHFISWPDHGTPNSLELVLFHRRVTSYMTQLSGQMIVHCSAGLGRTGTFIALDALLTQGKRTERVDIPRYVRAMRKDRMNMIQNYEQYIALHELLVEGFNLQESNISRSNFPKVLATMCPKNTPANQTKSHQEFKALLNFKPSYSPRCFKAAMLKENKSKNRKLDILPADQFRVFLQSQPANRTDYINAISVQSHTSKSAYLMTQFPMEDTIGDFWTMVFDYRCESIVVLGQPTEGNWLEGDSTTSNFSFTKLNERSMDANLTISDYHVTGERQSTETTVRLFSLMLWSGDKLLPPSDSSLLQLLELVDGRRRSNNETPVIVMCRDGCTQSGLFCCVSNARDQMKLDGEVDIFQTARQLKQRRPESLEDIEQYQYCYDFIGQYLDSTDVYIN